jgi:hypothetical protein
MTESEANALIECEKPLDIHSDLLIGYERISTDISSYDPVGRMAIAKMILDCNGTYGKRKIYYKLSIDKLERLSFWTLPPDIEPC